MKVMEKRRFIDLDRRGTKEIEMKTCDYCEETWEDDFFCPTCSGLQEIETEGCFPDLFYDGCGPDYVYEVRTETMLMSVCGNCCPGHKQMPNYSQPSGSGK